MSRYEQGLTNMLKALKTYTEVNGMTLNVEKTKVMIFNSSGRHMRRNFYFGSNKIETTRQYKYLGFKGVLLFQLLKRYVSNKLST